MATKVTVKSGQTLSSIAKANNTTVSAILAVNPTLSARQKAGQTVLFNGTKVTIPTAINKTPPKTNTPGLVNTGTGADGAPAVVDKGISSGANTTMDTLSMATLQSKFGIAAAVIGSDKSLSDVLNKILGIGVPGGTMTTDPALQLQMIQGTTWFRNQTDTQRQFTFAKETNPGQFAADLQKNASDIVKQFFANGINITAADAISYAEQMMQQAVIKDGKVVRYNQDFLNKLMSNAIKFTKTNDINGKTFYDMTGKLETMSEQLYQRAWEYGYPASTSNKGFETWFENSIKGLVAGTLNPEDVDNELQKRAMSLFPGLKDGIAKGQSLREAADPYLNAIANTWEIDPNTLDLNDDTVQQVLNYTDEKGNIQPMNLYGAKKTARRSKNFDFTQVAKEEKTSIASTILKDFGFLG